MNNLNTPKDELTCAKCNVIVNHDRRSNITKHRESTKHLKAIKSSTCNAVQSFISWKTENVNDFTRFVTKAFLSADIPLYKANNRELQALFSFLGKPLPSETILRSQVSTIADLEMLQVQNLISEKKIFVIVDESDISGKRIFNALIGTIENPDRTYLIDCRICYTSFNHQFVVHFENI